MEKRQIMIEEKILLFINMDAVIGTLTLPLIARRFGTVAIVHQVRTSVVGALSFDDCEMLATCWHLALPSAELSVILTCWNEARAVVAANRAFRPGDYRIYSFGVRVL
jgi:Na+(H+)/acetate symporter ActP